MNCGHGNSINDILFKLVHMHFLRVHSYLDKIGLHPGQGKVLMILRSLDGVSQKEICEKLNVKPSTIAVMIKRMEKTEYIERKNDENDQRISRIFITKKGLEVCELLEEVNKKLEKECLSDFTEEEIETAKLLLSKMRDNLMHANEKCNVLDDK